MLPIQDHPSGLSFRIRVQPKSSRNQILGMQDDALKLKITAPRSKAPQTRTASK